LGHGILGHPPRPPLSEAGCRNFDPILEQEANFLGPTLLVPRPAALRIAWRGMSLVEAAQEYGVSESVIKMRLNLTGALVVVSRTRARRGNPGQHIQR
jgi:Zn-dependent peptidase ImmA (M78 family)